ncbi:hypothetical protein POM88_019598 [Heracleum sosnowskyi]|uniref:CCHC-type domain-containing protein n=1 Tax=Heracleum sosnowskyi TaxID=360622 RepID=A0AAD8IAY7_9APIA|nr:hypothetical protein POM88_019598 [Heracleum sosnowskyi]
MNGLVSNIRALGETMDDSYVVKKLLRAVPSKFLQITSTIEQFGNLDTMTVEETVGSLKAHEERLKGNTETNESQLLLTKEEWEKRENNEGKLLLTREEWIKRSSGEGSSVLKGRGGRDKRKIRCFNCQVYGHYAAECRKPKRTREQRQEANMAFVEDDEPALLLAKLTPELHLMLLNEKQVVHALLPRNEEKVSDSNVWYLDNGANNHMTGFRTKFTNLDESVRGQVYGHYAAECRKPKRTREQRQEVNMAFVEDDELALLLAKLTPEPHLMLLNEKQVVPALLPRNEEKVSDSNVWYLDNGASNHMTGFRTKFTNLDESVRGQVRLETDPLCRSKEKELL